MKNHILSASTFILLLVPGAQAIGSSFVAVPSGIGADPGIFRLQDKNGDGDARDSGESQLFRDGAGAGVSTPKGFVDVAVGPSGVIYAIDPDGDRIFGLRDKDGDGDAQSTGEISVIYQSISVEKAQIASIAVGAHWDEDAGVSRDAIFAFDPINQSIFRFIDWDDDGVMHPESVDEVAPYHTLSSTQPFTSQRMEAGPFGVLFGTLPNSKAVARIWSANGDGALDTPEDELQDKCSVDETYDAKEYLTIQQDTDILRGVFGVARQADRTLLVTVPPNDGQDVGRIYYLKDLDGNEDAEGASEFGQWARLLCSAEAPNLLMTSPTDIVSIDGERVIVADHSQGMILWFEDINSDGDAEDSGECGIYATNLPGVLGLASAQEEPVDVTLTLTGTDVIDEGKGPSLAISDTGMASATVTVTDSATDLPVQGVPVRCDVLQGCLTCDARIQKSGSNGRLTVQVAHGGASPLTSSGELMLTAAGGQTLFFEAVWPLIVPKDETGNNLYTLDFGEVDVGNSASQLILLYNEGSAPLEGEASSDSTHFVVTSDPYSIDEPSSPALIEVVFAPTAEGAQTGNITFTGGGGSEIYVEGVGASEGSSCDSSGGENGSSTLFVSLLTLLSIVVLRKSANSQIS